MISHSMQILFFLVLGGNLGLLSILDEAKNK